MRTTGETARRTLRTSHLQNTFVVSVPGITMTVTQIVTEACQTMFEKVNVCLVHTHTHAYVSEPTQNNE